MKHDDWVDDVIRRVFDVTLDEAQGGSATFFLEGLEIELQEQLAIKLSMGEDPAPLRLKLEQVDQVIVEILSFEEPLHCEKLGLTKLQFLLQAWNRVDSEQARSANSRSEERVSVLNELSSVILRYVVMLVSNPELFPNHTTTPPGARQLVDPLLRSSSSSGGLPPGVLQYLIESLSVNGSDELDDVFHPVFTELSLRLRPITLSAGNESPLPYIHAFKALLLHKPLCESLVRHKHWLPDPLPSRHPNTTASTAGKEIETRTIIGPLLRLTVGPDDREITKSIFVDFENRNRHDVNASVDSLRSVKDTIHSLLHKGVFLPLFKACDETREALLHWIAQALERNRDRGKLQFDARIVASLGFFETLTNVLLLLCDPFLDAIDSKRLNMIHSSYYDGSGRFDMEKETRLASTETERLKWLDQRNESRIEQYRIREQRMLAAAAEAAGSDVPRIQEGPPPEKYFFICELFFMTVRSFEFMVLPAINRQTSLGRHIQAIRRELSELKLAVENLKAIPNRNVTQNFQLQRKEKEIEMHEKSEKLCAAERIHIDVLLSAPTFVNMATRLCAFSLNWVMHLIDPQRIGLPLPPPPMELKALPEFIIENVAKFMLFMSRSYQRLLRSNDMRPVLLRIMTASVALLDSPIYVRNPDIRGQLMQIVSFFAPEPEEDQAENHGFLSRFSTDGPFTYLFDECEYAQKHLAHAMVAVFVDVGQTGGHNQFFDKFSTRGAVSRLLRYLWSKLPYRQSVVRLLSGDREIFDPFGRAVIDDFTFLLDEALGDLEAMHNHEVVCKTPEFESQTAEEKKIANDKYEQAKSGARFNLQVGNEYIAMVEYMSREPAIVECFISDKLVGSLAIMLNYCVFKLAGPTMSKLKVRDPEKVRFTPGQILGRLCHIYVKMAQGGEIFVEHVAMEERSFKPPVFARAVHILRRHALVHSETIAEFEAIISRATAFREQKDAEDDDLEDGAPDDFLDALTYSLMTDPVILPASKIVVDRSTIERHLLSDPTDPFSRAALAVEDLIPDDALKARIEEWLAEKRAKKLKRALPSVSEESNPSSDHKRTRATNAAAEQMSEGED